MLNTEIQTAATSYVTDRTEFLETYGEGSMHKQYLDMLFIGASTRPDLSETIPILLCGGIPNPEKHGIDGLPGENNCHIEVKVSTTDLSRKQRHGVGNITINDPSQSIFDKYDSNNVKFIFPLFVDGHLLTIFSVEWQHLRQYYVDGINDIFVKNQKKTASGGAATRNFSLTTAKWLPNAELVFINKDRDMLFDMLKASKASKPYVAKVKEQMPML